MAEPESIPIGRLRWIVWLATRVQAQDSMGTGILENLAGMIQAHADIQPVGALTFWGAQQTDSPITHRIFIRWMDGIDNTWVVFRRTLRGDGTARVERFRVRRVKDIAGRKRFLLLEVEQEANES